MKVKDSEKLDKIVKNIMSNNTITKLDLSLNAK